MELGGFAVGRPTRSGGCGARRVEQCLNMMVMNPYPGFEGEYFEMPCRNVVPKPMQKPHPPVWVACSNRETIKLAARLRHRRAHFRLRRSARGQAMGRRLLPHLPRGMRADRPRGQSQHRHGDGILGASATARRRARRGEDGFRFFGYALGASLYLRRAQARPHRHLGEFREGAPRAAARPAPIAASARPTSLRTASRRISRSRASTRSPSSSRAAATGTSTSARRSSSSRAT